MVFMAENTGFEDIERQKLAFSAIGELNTISIYPKIEKNSPQA